MREEELEFELAAEKEEALMARLTAKGRKRLKKSSFVYPKTRSYPIHDRAHARAALAFAKRKNTKGSYSTVRKKVCARYPDMCRSTTSRKRKRK